MVLQVTLKFYHQQINKTPQPSLLMSKPWINAHKPEKLSDVIGQDKIINDLKTYIETYSGQKKKSALLYGPSGCGKTLVVSLLAKHYGYELIEINASDARNKASIEALLGPAMEQQSLFFKSKIILIDEVDGLSGRKDRGGAIAVLNLAKTSPFPVLLTCENAWHEKLSKLRSKCSLMKFETPDHKIIAELITQICKKENVSYEETAINTIARRSGGDIRSAITDAHSLAQVHSKITAKEIATLEDRWRNESITNALIKIFKNSDPAVAIGAFDNVHEDIDKCILWIDENLPKEYKDPHDLARAYDALSMADVFRGRIRRWQHWRFLVYVNTLITAGVATAKKNRPVGFVKYAPTQRLLRIWRANMKYQKRKAISLKVAEMTHTSSKRAMQDILPYLGVIFKNKPEWADKISEDFQLDPEEALWLKN